MYRVRITGRWLPWVSNANPDWMRSVQEKYDLGGTLQNQGKIRRRFYDFLNSGV